MEAFREKAREWTHIKQLRTKAAAGLMKALLLSIQIPLYTAHHKFTRPQLATGIIVCPRFQAMFSGRLCFNLHALLAVSPVAPQITRGPI